MTVDNKYPCPDCGTLDTGTAGHFDGCAKNSPAPPRECPDCGKRVGVGIDDCMTPGSEFCVRRVLANVRAAIAASEDARRKAEAERDAFKVERDHLRCAGCEVCHCGAMMDGHSAYDNHAATPMCDGDHDRPRQELDTARAELAAARAELDAVRRERDEYRAYGEHHARKANEVRQAHEATKQREETWHSRYEAQRAAHEASEAGAARAEAALATVRTDIAAMINAEADGWEHLPHVESALRDVAVKVAALAAAPRAGETTCGATTRGADGGCKLAIGHDGEHETASGYRWVRLVAAPPPSTTKRECTCVGYCRGAEGLAPGWLCVMSKAPPSTTGGDEP
jgi:hypothetical protein